MEIKFGVFYIKIRGILQSIYIIIIPNLHEYIIIITMMFSTYDTYYSKVTYSTDFSTFRTYAKTSNHHMPPLSLIQYKSDTMYIPMHRSINIKQVTHASTCMHYDGQWA